MMIVASIAFMTIAEGMMLFVRLQTRRIDEAARNGAITEGIWRMESIAATARRAELIGETVIVYRDEAEAAMTLVDSALIYSCEGFADTLFTKVGKIRLTQSDYAPDTLEVTIGIADETVTLRFATGEDREKRYVQQIEETENDQTQTVGPTTRSDIR